MPRQRTWQDQENEMEIRELSWLLQNRRTLSYNGKDRLRELSDKHIIRPLNEALSAIARDPDVQRAVRRAAQQPKPKPKPKPALPYPRRR